jgi:hypothetical protein
MKLPQHSPWFYVSIGIVALILVYTAVLVQKNGSVVEAVNYFCEADAHSTDE